MISRRLVGGGVTLLIIVLASGLILGQILGQPILLSYVETGSMAPTLNPGDGFIAVPPVLAGGVSEGDVITFDAERLNGGGLVTHRVVEETSAGYITKGDANAVTDQDGREPPVSPAQVKAVALQVNGVVVALPGVGLIVLGIQDLVEGLQRQLAIIFGTRSLLGTQGLSYILLGIGVLTYIGSVLLERRNRATRSRRRPTPSRPIYDTRTVIAILTIGVIVLTSVAMLVPAGPQTIEIVSSSADSPRPNVIVAGTTETMNFSIENRGLFPAVGFLQARDPALTLSRSEVFVKPGTQATLRVSVQAPPETGLYRYTMTRHWYLAVLPTETIRALYTIHPLAPIVAIDLIFAVGFATFALGVVGFGRYRVREESPWIGTRLRRQFERLFR